MHLRALAKLLIGITAVVGIVFVLQLGTSWSHAAPMESHDMSSSEQSCENDCTETASSCATHCLFSASSYSTTPAIPPLTAVYAFILASLTALVFLIAYQTTLPPPLTYIHSNRIRLLSILKLE